MPKGMGHKSSMGKGKAAGYGKTGALAGGKATKYTGAMTRHGSTKKSKRTKSY